MTSGQTPLGRNPDRPGEPDAGSPSDGGAVSELNSGGNSVSAKPTYAESERDGWPTGPTRVPETDAAVAAASAAAAAAVAAVSAAIAATSATNANRARRRAAAKLAAEAAAAEAATAPAVAAASVEMPAAPVVAPQIAATQIAATPVAAAPVFAAPVFAAPVTPRPVVAAPVVTSPPVSTHYTPPDVLPDVPGIIRAPRPQPVAPAAAAALSASAPTTIAAVPGTRRRAVPTTNYVRPDPPPDVPGIIRAPIVEDAPEAVTAPAPPPLFSNEGALRKSETRSGVKGRVAGTGGGVGASLLAAGSALADRTGPALSALATRIKAAGTTPPDGVDAGAAELLAMSQAAATPPARLPDSVRVVAATSPAFATAPAFAATGPAFAATSPAFATAPAMGELHGFRASRPFVWIASIVLAIRMAAVFVGSVLAVVFLPILLGLGRMVSVPANAVSRWVQGDEAGTPDFDADGNPRKKRRVAPFWLAFAGFYCVLAVIIGMVWFGSALGSSPASPNSSGPGRPGGLAGVTSPSPSASPSPSPSEIASLPLVIVPGGSSSTSPSTAPSTSPSTSAAPTKKPTPKPTKKPTPKPTPRVLFAKFVQLLPPATSADGVLINVQSLPTATCVVVTASSDPSHHKKTFTIFADGYSGQYLWSAGAWPAGPYHLTMTCSLTGFPDATATKSLTV
jgi:trimeric autotransporter adhesin